MKSKDHIPLSDNKTKNQDKASEQKKESKEEKAAKDAKLQQEGEERIRKGKDFEINAYADFIKKPLDIILLGNSISFKDIFIPIHAKSSDTAKDVFENIFSNVKPGSALGGDFNVNFLEPKTVIELEKALVKYNLCMDMSNESIAQLNILFKTRSVSSIFSQQLFKNGVADCALKDLPFFRVRNREGDEPVLPAKLKEKFADLTTIKEQFMKGVDELIEQNTYSEESATKLSKQFKHMVSFHDLESSKGHDHLFFQTLDDKSDTIFIFQNSVKQEDYKMHEHFNKDKFNYDDPEEMKKVKELYAKYDNRIYSAMYLLLLTRDAKSDPDFENRSPEEIKKICVKMMKENSKVGSLTKEQFRTFYIRPLRKLAFI